MVTTSYAFLFTDIEGSTRRWERDPVAMSEALRVHDEILRTAIEAEGGTVFKTIGDAFCAVFTSAHSAALAAACAQQTLMAVDWGPIGPIRVRMAIHCGPAEARDQDYFGPTLNRVARLLGVGHGGQVLLSEAARNEVMVFGEVEDLGLHRLKDLGEPVRVFLAPYAGMPSEFPPLASLRAERHNLPVQSSSFIGRDQLLAEVAGRLAQHRLVSLVGAGGVGKTRAVVQAGADLVDRFEGGVWLVSLEALDDPGLVGLAAAEILQLKLDPGQDASDALGQALRARSMLLIFDNCEHLTTAVARTVGAILRAAPDCRVLATSRAPLGVAGEQVVRVPSLELPGDRRDLAALARCESVALFVERATAARAEFGLEVANADAVAEICAMLDGIPLALELAAARVTALSVHEIRERLVDRFRLLRKGRNDVLPRHQTLLALVEWSYNLLDPTERELLRRVSVFSGGWDLSAAERVGASPTLEEWDVVDALSSLVDKSLVHYEAHAGRYSLPQSVRAFAYDHLERGGEAPSTHAAHADHYRRLALGCLPELGGPDPRAALSRLETEHDNLRKAFGALRGQTGSPDDWVDLAVVLGRFWELRGHLAEGYHQLSDVAERLVGVRTKAASDAINAHGNLARHLGHLDVADARYREALARRRELGDEPAVAGSLSNLSTLCLLRGQPEEARGLVEEARATNARLGNGPAEAVNLLVLGNIEAQLGRREAAADAFRGAMARADHAGHRMLQLHAAINLGLVAGQLGNVDEADARLRQALAWAYELGDKATAADAMRFFAQCRGRRGEAADAARWYGAAERLREEIGSALPEVDRAEYEADLEGLRQTLGTAFADEWRAGREMDWERACHPDPGPFG